MIYVIGSIPTLILGILIWKFEMVDIIAGYDEKKCTDKAGMARWVGVNLIVISLVMIGFYFLFKNVEVSTTFRMLVPVAVFLIMLTITAVGTRMYEIK